MFRRTFTGSLVAASLTAGALMTMPAASAAPTWIGAGSVSGVGFLPASADVAVSDNGATVATWVAGGRVMASTAAHGAWGPAKFVSDAGKVVSNPSVAVNDQGDAAITWTQEDISGDGRLAVSHRKADTNWDGWGLISPDQLDAGKADLGLDANGILRAAYVATDGDSFNQVQVATKANGTNAFTTMEISDSDAFAPSLDVNPAGTVLVSWMDVEGAESMIRSRRQSAPGATWGAVKDMSPLGSYLAETDTAISDSGFGTVAFVQNWNGDALAAAVKVQADGTYGSSSFASEVGRDASQIDLDQNATGTALLSWVYDGTEIGYATRKQTAGWVKSEINSPVAAPQQPRSSIADNGTTILIGYVGNEHLLASYRTNPLVPLSHSDSGDLNIVSASTLAGMDAQGNAFLGAIRLTNPGEGEVRGAFLDAAGPTAATAALAAQVFTPKFNVGWSASDRLSNVTTGSVRVRSAAWNGGFGGYTYPLLNSVTKAFGHTGIAGSTYCFSSQAKDSVGNLSAWSGERCTTLPVDDRSLKRVKGFKKATGSAHYLGTFVKAKTRGSKLTLANVKATRLAIVVSKAAKGGKIKVVFAGQSLGTYSLKGTGSKKLVAVKSFGSLKAGTLVIKVVSKTGKVVKIDGVVAAK